MEIVVKFLSGGSWQSIVIICLFTVMVVCVLAIVVGAFIQGRSIGIWPPAMGERPPKSDNVDSRPCREEGVIVAAIDNEAIKGFGIREIFPRRDLFQTRYPLSLMASHCRTGSLFRIVGRTLYLVINQPQPLKTVLTNGASLQLCFFDPAADPGPLKKLAHMEQHDTLAALATFRNSFVEWLLDKKPAGTLELRYHNVQLIDSWLLFNMHGLPLAVWDLTFGRDVGDKWIFLLETSKGIGARLAARYDSIWKGAGTKFLYRDGAVLQDELEAQCD